MSEHALLSASAASRWLVCTPSVRRCEPMKDTAGDFAKEGTLAHEICELKLKKKFTVMPQKTFTAALNKLKKHELFQDEMLSYTEDYLEYITEIVYGLPSKPYLAIEKRVDYSAYAQEGFGTADCLIIHGDTLRVIDFKYGKGVSVSAENNPQMLLYALGAVSEFGCIYSIKRIIVSIVQPRLSNISEWETPIDELLAFGNDTVKPAAEKAFLGLGEYVPGEHCRFCKAKSQCRARADENLKLAQFEFKKPPLLSNEEVGNILTTAINLAKWVKDLEEFALSELLNGNDILGWKAVEGRSNRTFIDVEKALGKVTASGIEETLLYERKPIALTAIEKLLGKKTFDELLANDLYKPQGKPTLAKENDNRLPFSLTSAQNDFKENIL